MSHPERELIINYVPGEECRVAVVQNGRIEEFFSERADNVSHVGNIYVGRVTNVEPAIQAAFVEFGLESAGFLHGSDLHPRYFPDAQADAAERIGKKIPRRDRPPIQDCLKRGDEVIVQVLKEGVGSKGPTVTSYLSIPGRFLVMMPGMDKVGVSRKVEDEDTRDKMKAILDQLELPEGFGFIVRTAGLDRTKAELKRDLAYLVRLQKDMEKRRKMGAKPRLLYSEGDLLFRSLRDLLTSDTKRVVIDSEIGLRRAARFMKIVSPRSTTMLAHYTAKTPVFHGMALEEQIRTIYSREVPLPSGGRLVIDEAEALVAIDVNSGKHRDASDSETNALKTNLEAVDEIARQLRLRDMGGIVVNDLIDMRAFKHRREVESKMAELMKHDRAKSTLTPISEFGLLEMTRQRMRGSHESQHFHDCPTCHGRGLIQRAESLAADALREAAAILDHDKVAKIEMVVHARVASELISTKRRQLVRLEKVMGKVVAVRLSDAVPMDRVSIYAYDASGNDVDVARLPKFKLTDEALRQFEDPDALLTDDGEDDVPILPEDTDDARDHLAAHEMLGVEIVGESGEPGDGENFQLDTSKRRGKGARTRGRGRGGKDSKDDRDSRDSRDGRDAAITNLEKSPFNQSVRPAHVEPAKISGPRMILEHPQDDADDSTSGQNGNGNGNGIGRPNNFQHGSGNLPDVITMGPEGEPIAALPGDVLLGPDGLPIPERGNSRGGRGGGAGGGSNNKRGSQQRQAPRTSSEPADDAPAGDAPVDAAQSGTPGPDNIDGTGPAAVDDGDFDSEGGRKRRRRRRGRNRNRGDGEPDGGPEGQIDGPNKAHRPSEGEVIHHSMSDISPPQGPVDSTMAPNGGQFAAQPDTGFAQTHPAGDGSGQDQNPREGGEIGKDNDGSEAGRGGRRRRGRGKSGGKGEGTSGGSGGGNNAAQPSPASGSSTGGSSRGGSGGRGNQGQSGGGGNRGSRGSRSRSGGGNSGGSSGGNSNGNSNISSSPAPAPAPSTPAVPAAPKPRTLYAAFRRLKPGQAGNVKREE